MCAVRTLASVVVSHVRQGCMDDCPGAVADIIMCTEYLFPDYYLHEATIYFPSGTKLVTIAYRDVVSTLLQGEMHSLALGPVHVAHLTS